MKMERLRWLSIPSILLIAGVVHGQQASERAPIPEAAALKDAEKLIKDLFKEDYAKKGISNQAALGKKLLEQSESAKDDPTTRYVLLRESNAIAAQAGDIATAFKAADQIGRAYKVDSLALKSESLQAASKAAKTPDDIAGIATAYLKLSKEATDADDFVAAEKAASAASTQGKRGQSVLLVNRAIVRLKEISDLKAKHDKIRKMKEALAANAEDPAANLEVGQYECFIKGNWAAGLPLLAKGSDAAIKDLAVRDLGDPSAPAEQAAVGDGWWDLGEKRPPTDREHFRGRAALWYEKAVGKLTGLALTKTEKRLFELRTEALGRGTWIDVSTPKLYGLSGTALTVPSGESVRLSKPPEGEFDGFTVRVKIPADKSCSVRIQYETGQKSLVIYHKEGQVQTAKLEGGTWRPEVVKVCPAKEEYLITILIAEGEYVVYLDTREIFRLPTQRVYFTLFDIHAFALTKGEATFDQIKLRRRQ